MKKLFAASAAAVAILAAGASAQAQDWSAAAQQDLKAIHDTLRDNSPAPYVDRDSATFRNWLDAGYAQVRGLDFSKVNNAAAYAYVLRGYTGGFRDANIQLFTSPTPPWYADTWPGFSTAWKNKGYVVAWSQGGSKYPPVGAQLISCDKTPIENIAKDRLDRYEGDLNLESDRYKTAPYLLWNRANPFVSRLPTKCDFLVNGKSKKSYTLNLAFGGDAERRAAFQAAMPKPQGIGLEQWNGGYWISLHSLDESQPWAGLLGQIEANRDAIRAAPVVVIDLRGSDAGTSARGYAVINRLWEAEFVRSKQPASVNIAYRVSQNNRDFYYYVLDAMNKDDLYFYQRPRWTEHLKQFDAALAAGQPILQRNEGTVMTEAVPANPMMGKVIVLTDYWCTGGCLDIVDILRSMPNVIHAGLPTGADTIFVGHVEAALPSGNARLGYGDKAWLDRARQSYQPFVPAKQFTGDIFDDAAVKAWVAGL